ncbi:hypothetical protein BUALT_Bualt17G0078600 [Buddleja alternifolia]|uniref:NB-ARC domain-containing protein n=1 Tax=Buddleja alternifolia TaxID=168488 RepID=A0AAV6WHN3_9LAMI|nr:hypothetical protein BUALT_Bualt17G0078600 [Buddleja alternifolia]
MLRDFQYSESESPGDGSYTSLFSQDLLKVIQEIEPIAGRMEKFIDDVKHGRVEPPISSISPAYVGSLGPAPIFRKKIVGFDEDLKELKNSLIEERTGLLMALPIIGMSGIGKTLLASCYDDPLTVQHFHTRTWTIASQEICIRDILLNLLDSMIVLDDETRKKSNDDQLAELVTSNLQGKRSRIIVTTRIQTVAQSVKEEHPWFPKPHRMHFLDEYDSWNLLRGEVFAELTCPSVLGKVGKKIARNCQGLPLAIINTGRHLAKAEKTPEYWNYIADGGFSVFADTEDVAVMVKQLSSCYKRLPQHLKSCFLYMAVFPQRYEIPASKLIKLWVAVGFLEPTPSKTLEKAAEHYLKELVDESLILVSKQSSTFGIKELTIHNAMWHLCSTLGEKHEFLHVINRYTDCILLSSARMVLDVLTVRFYNFPTEIFLLFSLRYLAATYNGGKLPDGLSNLRNLQYLIVRLHQSVKFSGAPSYLPVEIWNMKELRHLQFMGSDLPDPSGAVLPNLLTLSDVSSYSCTKEVFRGIPNLKKLGIRIVLMHHDAVEPFRPFNHLVQLKKLKSLKCVVVNPRFESQGPMWDVKDVLCGLKFLLLEDMDLVHWRSYVSSFMQLRHLSIGHCYKLEEFPDCLGKIFSVELIELVDCNPLAVALVRKLGDRQRSWEYEVFPFEVRTRFSWDDEKLNGQKNFLPLDLIEQGE